MFDLELRPTWAEIDLDALIHNFEEVRRIVGPRVKILSVIKADAYGHGAVECGKALLEAGADCLAVAFIDEAIALEQAGAASREQMDALMDKGRDLIDSASDLIRERPLASFGVALAAGWIIAKLARSGDR